jgi:hypothetical protein
LLFGRREAVLVLGQWGRAIGADCWQQREERATRLLDNGISGGICGRAVVTLLPAEPVSNGPFGRRSAPVGPVQACRSGFPVAASNGDGKSLFLPISGKQVVKT